jgi:hypothetical protein
MACNNCHELDQIPECTETLELGNIAVDTEVYIYVKNLFTEYVHRQEAISDVDGLLTLDLTQPDPSFYNKDSAFEIWVTLRTDNVKLDVTVAYGTVADCMNLSFFPVNDTYELPE